MKVKITTKKKKKKKTRKGAGLIGSFVHTYRYG